MRYILRSGNKKAVSEHEHATVLLEQQLIAISKQAQQARHESFTTAARQTQFGSCDPVPRLYLTPPQIDRPPSEIDVICYDIKEAYARATSNGRTRNHVSLPGFLVRQVVSL